MQTSANPAETANKKREKTIAKIRKLYAMSKETEASPHEAEIALRQCQSLMSRFGVQESELETTEFGKSVYQTIRNTIPSYVKVLAASVAKLHDCICVRSDGQIEFRGFEIDVTVCNLTLTYLDETLARYLRNAKNRGDVAAGRSASYDFRMGFAVEVKARIAKMKQENADVQSTGTSLAVKKIVAVKSNCMDGVFTGRGPKMTYRDSSHATLAGRIAGSKVSLNSQVTNGAHTPELA